MKFAVWKEKFAIHMLLLRREQIAKKYYYSLGSEALFIL